MMGLANETDQSSRPASEGMKRPIAMALSKAARETRRSPRAGLTIRVIRLIRPVMPSASDSRASSRPENSRMRPSPSTARAETTFSTSQP
jgi:hypothetical protein